MNSIFRIPRFGFNAYIVWRRNFLVWRKLIGPGIVLHFGEPLIYLLGLGFGFGMLIGNIQDMPYLTFLTSGLIASSAMMTASLEGTYSVFTRMVPQQTYKAIMASPIEVDDILAGELVWCATKALFSSTAILIVGYLLGAVSDPRAIWALPVVFLSALCFTGPAIVIASFSRNYDFFNYYFTLGITPMFVLCGVFYPTSTLPQWLQGFIQILPLTHAVELIRPLVASRPLENITVHVGVLLFYAVGFYYIAVVLVRKKLIV